MLSGIPPMFSLFIGLQTCFGHGGPAAPSRKSRHLPARIIRQPHLRASTNEQDAKGRGCVSSLSWTFFLGLRDALETERGSARKARLALVAVFAFVLALTTSPRAADLVIASYGRPQTTIVLVPNAGPWEQRAATDLQKYIRLMSGAEPAIAAVAPEAAASTLY